VLALRITNPALERPFRTPAVFIVAPLGVVSSVFLMAGLPSVTWIRFVSWLVIGILLYGFYGMRHSRAGRDFSASRS
jgi:APA family basic amino acid/polyamine antiporter